jgi:predicted HTH transcriptional regulator
MKERMMPELNEKNILELISAGESETVELKTALPSPAILARYLAAFANTAGGILIVGVKEPDVVVGADEKRTLQAVERSKSFLSSLVDTEARSILVNGKIVVAITVKPSREIVFGDGQALGRLGHLVRPLSPTQLSAKLGTVIAEPSIDRLAESISKQTEIIETLRDELHEANSLKSKMKDYVIGGTIGAVTGFLLSLLLLIK